MRYALNVRKGTVVNHPSIGKLQGGVAYPVTDEEANQLKNIINIVVFDSVAERKD